MITAFECESPNKNGFSVPQPGDRYACEYFGLRIGFNRCVKVHLMHWKFIVAYYKVDGTDEEGDAELAISMCELRRGGPR